MCFVLYTSTDYSKKLSLILLHCLTDMGQFAPHHSWGYSHSTAYSTWPGGGGCTNFTPPALTTGFTGTATAMTSELHTSLSAGHHHDLFPTCVAQTTASGKLSNFLLHALEDL